MKAIKLHSFLFAGTLMLVAVSCREENRRDDRYDNDRYETGTRPDRTDVRDKDGEYRNVSYSSSIAAQRTMITGDDGNKVWRVKQDLNDQGVDEAYSRDEEFHFYTNGGLTIASEDVNRSGNWSYDGYRLSLRYPGDGSVYSYRVLELTNNRMRLQASDGSELVLADKDFR